VDYKNLLLAKENGIGIVTVNRPGVLNALNTETYQEIYEMFTEIENDPEIRVVILTGAGEKAFAAGVDIRDMKDNDSVTINEFLVTARKAGDRIYKLSKPVIAAVNGYAFGGGNELALDCDLRIASENARFGQQEINVGVIPGGGAIPRLTQIVGLTRAKEIVFTGEMFDARTALQIGLVNKVVPPGELMAEARALAGKLLAKSSVILSYAKQAFNTGLDMDLPSALDLDECYFARCFATEDQKEGMTAFTEKRKPEFKNR
jgi:enoyl-CoA hydratase